MTLDAPGESGQGTPFTSNVRNAAAFCKQFVDDQYRQFDLVCGLPLVGQTNADSCQHIAHHR